MNRSSLLSLPLLPAPTACACVCQSACACVCERDSVCVCTQTVSHRLTVELRRNRERCAPHLVPHIPYQAERFYVYETSGFVFQNKREWANWLSQQEIVNVNDKQYVLPWCCLFNSRVWDSLFNWNLDPPVIYMSKFSHLLIWFFSMNN